MDLGGEWDVERSGRAIKTGGGVDKGDDGSRGDEV